uniref:Uncharacterized protein n=1 Tax=Rhizophora mucronata TaxID=61149 RepID=A0A2P2IZD0_RHIMU
MISLSLSLGSRPFFHLGRLFSRLIFIHGGQGNSDQFLIKYYDKPK